MPRTTDDSATTTNTPTATPMIVRSARTLFARIDSIARETPSSARSTRLKKPISLLLTQRFDRIEERCAASWVDAGGDPDDESEQRCRDDRPRCNGGRQEGELPRQPLGDGDAQRDADDGAEGTQRRRLDKKLPED